MGSNQNFERQALYVDMCSQDKLASRESKVKSLVCHPGGAITNLHQNTAASGKGSGVGNPLFAFVTNMISQSSADGSLPLLACAVDPEAQSGDFYVPGQKNLGSWLTQVWIKLCVVQVRCDSGILNDCLVEYM
jgi:hypothetical protein